jgi:hypothetical protein
MGSAPLAAVEDGMGEATAARWIAEPRSEVAFEIEAVEYAVVNLSIP